MLVKDNEVPLGIPYITLLLTLPLILAHTLPLTLAHTLTLTSTLPLTLALNQTINVTPILFLTLTLLVWILCYSIFKHRVTFC